MKYWRYGSAVVILIGGIATILVWDSGKASAQTAIAPELPRSYVDTTYAPPTGGSVIKVGNTGNALTNGTNFQNALNQVKLGDIIELTASAEYEGQFYLRNKTIGNGWIYVRSSRYAELPPPGTRVDPALHSQLMPKLVVKNLTGFVLGTDFGAHHYRFEGIEFTKRTGNSFSGQIISLGDYNSAGQRTDHINELPHHIIFDRSYIHGTPQDNTLEGIRVDGMHIGIVDSYLSDIHHTGNGDTQAILGINAAGPLKIVNNYIEAAGENVMFGGADPRIRQSNGGIDPTHPAYHCFVDPTSSATSCGLVNSDIEFRNNHVIKPLSWNMNDPSYAGIDWKAKNLFELKNAQRVWVEGNIFENSWVSAQAGYGIVLTPRNQSNTAPWSTIEDFTFRYNIVRDVNFGLSILPNDNLRISDNVERFNIRDNLFEGVKTDHFVITRWHYNGSAGPLIPAEDISFEHNTILHSGTGHGVFQIEVFDVWDAVNQIGIPGLAADPLIFKDNIVTYGTDGFISHGLRYTPNNDVTNNVVVRSGGGTGNFPSGNLSASSVNTVGFVNYAAGNYQLSSNSPYRNAATDGKDIGADVGAINLATAGVVTGSGSAPSPVPTATATPTATASPSVTPSPTGTPIPSPSPTPTLPPSPTASPTPVPITATITTGARQYQARPGETVSIPVNVTVKGPATAVTALINLAIFGIKSLALDMSNFMIAFE